MNEEFSLEHVMKYSENDTVIIKAEQIEAPYFRGNGWSKVEQKIDGVTVHHMTKIDRNRKITHATDYKITD